MTCLVGNMLYSSNASLYKERSTWFGFDPSMVTAIATVRNGCSVNCDTSVVKQHVQQYMSSLIQTLTVSSWGGDKSIASTFCNTLSTSAQTTLLGSTALQKTACAMAGLEMPTGYTSSSIEEGIMLNISSYNAILFAWQLGGTLLDTGYAISACTTHLSALNTGLDMLGLNAPAFTGVFCEIFQTRLYDTWTVDMHMHDSLASTWAATMFGLSTEVNYLCFLCGGTLFEESFMDGVGLNTSDVSMFINHACGIYGYDITQNMEC